jgi:2-oxoisovalerate dehydrogenase E1 component
MIPLGKARMVQEIPASDEHSTLTVITYGMGVYWAKNAANLIGKPDNHRVEILDLRTINPLDEEAIIASVKKHGRCMVLTEEPCNNGFAQALAGRIAKICFEFLDAPIEIIGAENLPAIPLNSTLEATMLPNAGKVAKAMETLLNY